MSCEWKGKELPPEKRTNALTRFSEAQIEIGNITKNKRNEHFKSGYVDLAQVLESITPVLHEHDLMIRQTTDYLTSESDGQTVWGDLVLFTEVVDTESGDVISSMTYPIICKDKSDPQKMGGGLTYARRYSILTITGSAAEDDDGNKAATPATLPRKEQTTTQKLASKLKSEGINDAESFKSYTKRILGVEVVNSKALTAEQIDTILGEGAPF